MPDFGNFTELTFVNGASPAINDVNLNEMQRVIKLTDSELALSNELKFLKDKEYYLNRNTQYLYLFTDYSDWTSAYPSQTTLSDEETNNLINDECLKIENILATAGWMSIYQTLASARDMSAFIDGSASDTGDLIVFWFYLSDVDAFSQLEIRLGDDFSNSYFIELASYSLVTGWNAVYPEKSDFTTYGSPTGWNSISYMRVAPYVDAGYSGEYIYFQPIYLYRKDPVYSGYSNIFQKYNGTTWENDFDIYSDVCGLVYDYSYDVRKIGFLKLNIKSKVDDLLIYEDLNYFRSKFEFVCLQPGQAGSVCWYVSSGNYIQTYIYNNDFKLGGLESAAGRTVSVSLDNNLLKGETITIYFEKNGANFRAILSKGNEDMKVLEFTTTISASSLGNLFVGGYNETGALLTDFIVSNKKINLLENETKPRFFRKPSDQSFTSNSMTDVTGFSAYLRPYGVYKIDLYLIARNSGSATPDVQIQWVRTNCVILTHRAILGPSTVTTDVRDTTVKMTEWSTAAAPYGLEGSADESFIYESFVVATKELGGLIKLQAAQYNTDAGNPSVIEDSSWMIITPVTVDKNS